MNELRRQREDRSVESLQPNGRRIALGVHALLFATGSDLAQVEQAASGAARAGFQALEIPVLEPDTIDSAATRELLAEHGIEPICSIALDPSTDIAGDDSSARSRGERLLFDALETAHEIGSSLLTGVTYGALGHHVKPASVDGRKNAERVVRALASAAGERGMRVGVEAINRYESNLINTSKEGLAFIDEVDAENVVLHLDTYHMNIEESDLGTPVLSAGERLGYVHVGESHRGYLGTGTVDFPSFFKALAQVGYGGTITFESFSTALSSDLLTSTLSIWRELWSDADDVAAHAHRFMTTQLANAAHH